MVDRTHSLSLRTVVDNYPGFVVRFLMVYVLL